MCNVLDPHHFRDQPDHGTRSAHATRPVTHPACTALPWATGSDAKTFRSSCLAPCARPRLQPSAPAATRRDASADSAAEPFGGTCSAQLLIVPPRLVVAFWQMLTNMSFKLIALTMFYSAKVGVPAPRSRSPSAQSLALFAVYDRRIPGGGRVSSPRVRLRSLPTIPTPSARNGPRTGNVARS